MAQILVIDDESAIRMLLLKSLISQGHSVSLAYDGFNGIEKVQAAKFDLIITDYAMPGMDGLTAFKKIQTIDPTLKALFISGEADLTINEEFINLRAKGVADFLCKPFNFKTLNELVERMISQNPS